MKNRPGGGPGGCRAGQDSHELTGGTPWTTGSDGTGGERGGGGSHRPDTEMKTDSED